jgi:hypothetical protein
MYPNSFLEAEAKQGRQAAAKRKRAEEEKKKTLAELLYQIETLRCWLEDTSYPNKDRVGLEDAVKKTIEAFDLVGVTR